MPPAAEKKSKKKSSARTSQSEQPSANMVLPLVAPAVAGIILGLSAPGFDQWYLAWFVLTPLILMIASSENILAAFVRGMVFGLGYNLMYGNWLMALHPLNWLGFTDWQSILVAGAAWFFAALHQAVIVGIFAAIVRLLPLTGSFIARKVEQKWCLPSLLCIPLLWVLVENKICNASQFLGVPWTMIEYSQYQQLGILQICKFIGGIGLGFLIVMVNVALAGLISTVSKKQSLKSLSAAHLSASAFQLTLVILIVTGSYAFGLNCLDSHKPHADTKVSILQGNINIDMQRTSHRYTLNELVDRYLKMASGCQSTICILPENALPTDLRSQKKTQQILSHLCRQSKLELLTGAIDYDQARRPFNSAYGFKDDGSLLDATYHKRYLVPFGEYTPDAVKYCPEWLQRLTNTPAGSGFAAGTQPSILYFNHAKVAPVICFESLSPELVTDSIRHGGQLLINLSDLAWFHNSMVGKQMLAFSVLRAVETGRYFVFAANSGPSAIIDPNGQITCLSKTGDQQVVKGSIGLNDEITPFTWWFR